MAMPAAVKRSNIHFYSLPGNPVRVGAYQTQGIGCLAGVVGKITKAGRPWSTKDEPGSGRFFAGASAANACDKNAINTATFRVVVNDVESRRSMKSSQG
jgi:hypothetical protein